uniref:Putative ovule protein n=1 Tax=Solanum chacoense TaxID=4108 RepID=A0A0V0H654_SOLCH
MEEDPVVSETANRRTKRTRAQTRVNEEQLHSSVNEEEREESFEDSENSGAIVEEPVVSETTNRPMGLQQHQFTEDEPVVSQTAIVVWAYSNSHSRRSVGNSESVVWSLSFVKFQRVLTIMLQLLQLA